MTQDSETGSVINCDAIIVGAGLSGCSMLHRLRKLNLDARILESGTDFGGIWHWNRYCGARVDSEWPFYQLNIPEVYRDWNFSQRFSDHNEIRSYFAHLDKTLDLRKSTYFEAHVVSATRDELSNTWTVETEQGHVARCKYLILSTGLLHRIHKPIFPGSDRYQGQIHHTGAWPESLEVKGKRVGIVGTGATAVQVTQCLAKEDAHLTVLMRRPSYCIPMGQRDIGQLEQSSWKAYYKVLFKEGRESATGFPAKTLPQSAMDVSDEDRERHLEEIWARGGFNFQVANYHDIVRNEDSNRKVYDFWAKKVRQRIKDPRKRVLMAPTEPPYFFGTKRVPLEQDYYECIDQDNVELVDLTKTPIKEFNETGILLDSSENRQLDLDIVVLATGFDAVTGSVTQMGLKNRDGMDIKEYWRDGIRTFLGMFVHGFPNAFMVFTPQAPTALSNGPTVIETQCDLITNAIERMEKEDIRSIEATSAAEDEWDSMIQQMNENTLYPLTNSWWNGGNIPGKKPQNLLHTAGVAVYDAQCKERLDRWIGFTVRY
ncbi:hypothetical protein LTR47_000982 [Exophiala xenobiotica]|nr:hypothetical protein LTR47_000982 [Exophiala xenobiotica]KAK5255075.1 hypothetical protein LTS06_000859 [Exophiala xenobiotica]KAK5355641.1 hypothetical protein LTR61_001314 [Exophiala xenobiotica]KAK5385462.1 hypothetical protein LTR11_001835 [Exophiala xenobiotica]KAK5386606.1 hypothetical protein LTS03_001880 [Exophiala xenobiotica]